MYEVNDVIVYQNGGICKIVDICTPDFMDTEETYYKMQPLDSTESVIYLKTDRDGGVTRPVISKEEANRYLEVCPALGAIYIKDMKIRDKEFKQVIRSCDCEKWFELLKGILKERDKKTAEGKKLTSTDDRNLKKVESLLSAEFSMALGISRKEAGKKIKEALGCR